MERITELRAAYKAAASAVFERPEDYYRTEDPRVYPLCETAHCLARLCDLKGRPDIGDRLMEAAVQVYLMYGRAEEAD